MFKIHNPSKVNKPSAAYSHGIEVAPQARWLHVSGQIGVAADGRAGANFEQQAEIAWRNLLAVLESADMSVENLVKVTSFLTSPDNIVAYRAIRDRFQSGHRPASTLVVVAGLASPQWLIEVEATAAKA